MAAAESHDPSERRPFCADVSAESDEPLHGTASRIDHWLLIEYRGVWSPHPLADSLLPEPVKQHLAEQLAALRRSRLVFIRRPERRGRDGVVCYLGRTREQPQAFSRLELDGHDDLLELDLAGALTGGARVGDPVRDPLFLVCTHGKRDRCCARYGRPLYDALREQADPDWVWQSTHVGGDRFAGNVVCVPEGVYYGRVRPADVWAIVDDHLAGRIYLDRFRGRCCYPFAIQVAERSIRAETGLRGIRDLALVSARAKGLTWNVRFRVVATGEIHELDVAGELGDLTYLTCSAPTLRRPRRYVTTGHQVHPAL